MATRRSRERYGNRPSPSSDRSVARPATGERREQMPRNQKHLGILAGPERRWRREDHANGMGIDLLHLQLVVASRSDRGGCRVGGVLPIEDHVVRSKRMTVVPAHAAFQLPGD